eukprot:g59556.t1
MRPRQVKNLTTGAVYSSYRKAARECGIHHNSIVRAVSQGWKAGGCHWEEVFVMPGSNPPELVSAFSSSFFPPLLTSSARFGRRFFREDMLKLVYGYDVLVAHSYSKTVSAFVSIIRKNAYFLSCGFSIFEWQKKHCRCEKKEKVEVKNIHSSYSNMTQEVGTVYHSWEKLKMHFTKRNHKCTFSQALAARSGKRRAWSTPKHFARHVPPLYLVSSLLERSCKFLSLLTLLYGTWHSVLFLAALWLLVVAYICLLTYGRHACVLRLLLEL